MYGVVVPAPPDIVDDLVLLLQACSAALGDRVLADTRAAAGEQVRFNDGYVFQHLVPGPRSVTDLARALGVTQQAASKQVADLERRGLVRRRADPADRRARLVELSDVGRVAVEAARTARRAIARDVTDALGAERTAELMAAARDLSRLLGAADVMAARRLRPEADR